MFNRTFEKNSVKKFQKCTLYMLWLSWQKDGLHIQESLVQVLVGTNIKTSILFVDKKIEKK